MDNVELGSAGSLEFLRKKYNVMIVISLTGEGSLSDDLRKGTLKNEFLNAVNFIKIQSNVISDFRTGHLNFRRQEKQE
jgi:hypothetical protein